MFTVNPLFGEICAIAEPDFNLSKSPKEFASKLNNPLPSPLNNAADTDDDMFNEPVT